MSMVAAIFASLFSRRGRGATRLVLLAIALAGMAVQAATVADPTDPMAAGTYELPFGSNPFAPSNAQTKDGQLIPEAAFFSATRCGSCHVDVYPQWSESLHRNGAREPFYKESVDILLRTRGIAFTRHCESCHTPVALISGALTKGSTQSRAMDDEGVTCVVCHSITEARVAGTGSYTIRRPALLVREDGTPVAGDMPNAAILADIPGHRRAMMRPLLKTPEFCATCHKVALPPDLNGYKSLRGFSAYDEWQQSGASQESALSFARSGARLDCRTCHMPKVESRHDAAAKDGVITLHRWPGANTAAPLFYGQTAQVELIERFLQNHVLSVDIFALTSETTGVRVAPLQTVGANRIALRSGAEVTAEVVVSNRAAAHSFPPEVRDLYEAWVEFEAIDASGRTLVHSGFVQPDGRLDERAHVYKTILLDEAGRTITRHQVWLARTKAYDNTILPGRSDVARFRFRLPADMGGLTPITLRARVNYRRFNQEYIDYVLKPRKVELSIPIVRMAEAEVRLSADGDAPTTHSAVLSAHDATARRWNDYGIGLLEQAQYGAAAEAFLHASTHNPSEPDLLVNAAIAEMRTERFGPEREQWQKAAALLARALEIDPTYARARVYRALVWRAEGKIREAADELGALARQYPRDREVQRELAQTLYTLGQREESRAAFEAVIAIDPQGAAAYQFLAPIYAREGRTAEAERTRALYLQWRDDPHAAAVAARFFAAHPEWADERVGSHAHHDDSPHRPVLTGASAAPDR